MVEETNECHLNVQMLTRLRFQYCLEIVVLERVVGQGSASVQVNGPWYLVSCQ